VHKIRPTKGLGAQIRRAGKAERRRSSVIRWEAILMIASISILPTSQDPTTFSVEAKYTQLFGINCAF
jgi:hypothetical protein